MSTELAMLVWSGLLSLLLALATIAIHFVRFGGTTIRGNREHYPALEGAAGRIVRAHANMNEALLPFAIVVIAGQLLHFSNGYTVLAAEIFLAARLAHAGLYAAGIPEVRSVAFYVAFLATIVFAAQLPLLKLVN